MNNFDFCNGYIPLFIGGNEFLIKPDSNFAKTLSSLSKEADVRADLAKHNGSHKKTSDFLCYVIDSLLGDNSCNRIFGDSEPDIFDLCDIISYICDSFSEYRSFRLSRLNKNTDLLSEGDSL